MSASRHDHWGDHPDPVLGRRPTRGLAGAGPRTGFSGNPFLHSYVLTLTSTMSRRRSLALCAGYPRRRPTRELAGTNPRTGRSSEGCLSEVTGTAVRYVVLEVSLRLVPLCGRGPVPLPLSLRLSDLCPSPPL